jgi:hypothetical protein
VTEFFLFTKNKAEFQRSSVLHYTYVRDMVITTHVTSYAFFKWFYKNKFILRVGSNALRHEWFRLDHCFKLP